MKAQNRESSDFANGAFNYWYLMYVVEGQLAEHFWNILKEKAEA